MNTHSDWEDILKASRFDLSQAKWDAMESRLRERIRADRESVRLAPSRPSFADRFRDAFESFSSWLAPTPVRWGAAGALGLLALGIGVWIRTPSPVGALAVANLTWTPGQTLESVGLQKWNWTSGRTHIGLRDGSMSLQKDSAGQIRIQVARGTASFQVDHRTASESFQVGFGECHIEVVGTAFTIHVDSVASSARIDEGRVRFLGLGHDRYLDAGQELSCKPASDAFASAPASPEKTPEPAASVARPATALPRESTPSPADLSFDQISRLCHEPGSACTEARADFVRRFPSDPRAAEVGWAWGESAKASGDLRDALFAWDVAARSDKRIGIRATIAAVELRLGDLPDAERAARDLERILPKLDPGSTLWVRGWTLRRDAARILGQTAIQQRADSILAAPRAASGGS